MELKAYRYLLGQSRTVDQEASTRVRRNEGDQFWSTVERFEVMLANGALQQGGLLNGFRSKEARVDIIISLAS